MSKFDTQMYLRAARRLEHYREDGNKHANERMHYPWIYGVLRANIQMAISAINAQNQDYLIEAFGDMLAAMEVLNELTQGGPRKYSLGASVIISSDRTASVINGFRGVIIDSSVRTTETRYRVQFICSPSDLPEPVFNAPLYSSRDNALWLMESELTPAQ